MNDEVLESRRGCRLTLYRMKVNIVGFCALATMMHTMRLIFSALQQE